MAPPCEAVDILVQVSLLAQLSASRSQPQLVTIWCGQIASSAAQHMQVDGIPDGQRLEDWPELARAVSQCFSELLAARVDPGRLARAMQTGIVQNFLGSVAAPDAFAPFADPLAEDTVAVPWAGPLPVPIPCPEAAGRGRGVSAPVQPDPASIRADAPAPRRKCGNPECDRYGDRHHTHCCFKCRDWHWRIKTRGRKHDDWCEPVGRRYDG